MLSTKSAHAIYMPAISSNFAKIGYSQHLKRNFSFAEKDLNFLDPASTLFHYPYALYSAGQAALTDGAAQQISIVSQRDRDRTTVIGDSGGFQIQEGTIKFEGDATCERMLRWMEGHADFSMSLDFPTGGISPGNVAVHTARLDAQGKITAMSAANGLSLDYNACLTQSLLNLDYFVQNRHLGKTNLLNVLQGRTERESKVWYDAVKGYPLEGWAFAGAHQSALSLTMARLLDMYDDGLLQNAKWIHFLGISTLDTAYIFTAMLRCIRQVNADIGISFDTSSPFKAAANFQFCSSFRFDKYGVGIATTSMPAVGKATDTRTLNLLCEDQAKPISIKRAGMMHATEIIPCPARTAIGDKVTVSELCSGSTGSSLLDNDSTFMLMNHNVQAYISAFSELHKSYNAIGLHDCVPVYVRAAKVAIEKIFEERVSNGAVAARDLLQKCTALLNVFAEVRN